MRASSSFFDSRVNNSRSYAVKQCHVMQYKVVSANIGSTSAPSSDHTSCQLSQSHVGKTEGNT